MALFARRWILDTFGRPDGGLSECLKKQGGDFGGVGFGEELVAEVLVHDGAGEAREGAHVVFGLVGLADGEEEDEADGFVVEGLPGDGMAEADEGKRVGGHGVRLAVGNGKAEAESGRVGLFAQPDGILDGIRPCGAAIDEEQIAGGFDGFGLGAGFGIESDEAGVEQRVTGVRGEG